MRLVALVGFVLAVVSTPGRAVWAFAVYASVLAAGLSAARVPARTVVRAAMVETPFVLFAMAMVFLGTGPRTEVFGVAVSIDGAWAAWAMVAKGTCGVMAATILAHTTAPADVLEGMDRLRVPRALTAIAAFMLRYLELTRSELRRLSVARVSRCDDPRWLWQGRTVAATAAALAVRTFERGERVEWAMRSRGFVGRFPDTSSRRVPLRWWPTMCIPVAAWAVAATALVTVRGR